MLHHSQHACVLRENPRISVDGALGYDAIWVYLIQFLRDIGVMLARTMAFAAVGAAALLFGPLTASAQDDHR